jgi:hypothetical protein
MSDTSDERRVGQAFLAEARRKLSDRHERIRHCLSQLDDAQVWWRPAESMNSAANLVLHLCGNLRQWLVAGVGGAADLRDRPREFAERGPIPRDELLRRLAAVVAQADAVLAGFDEARLLEPRRIQGFDETVLSAVFDCLTHLSSHAQEIVYVTRLQLGEAYRFAWVPATPEQGAAPEPVRACRTGSAGTGAEPVEGDDVAAADAVFEEMPTHPLPEETPAEPGDDPPPVPPLNDYLLGLEQEFQEDEEQGKL